MTSSLSDDPKNNMFCFIFHHVKISSSGEVIARGVVDLSSTAASITTGNDFTEGGE